MQSTFSLLRNINTSFPLENRLLKSICWKLKTNDLKQTVLMKHMAWKDLTDESHQLRSKKNLGKRWLYLFANFFTDVSSSSVHWCLSLVFPTMFVAYKLQLAQTSNKLTTRWKLKSRSKSKPPRKTNWNRSWDRSPKQKSKWKSKLTENWNRDRNRDRLLKSRSKSRSTPENETKMEIDFGAKKTFGSRLRVRFLGPLMPFVINFQNTSK